MLGQYYLDSPRYFSHEIGRLKPAAGLLRKVCQENGSEPGQAVMIGDDYLCDIAPTFAAGTKSIWVTGYSPMQVALGAKIAAGRIPPPSLAIPSISQFDVRLLESI